MDIALKLAFVIVVFYLIYRFIFGAKRGLTLFEMHFKEGRLNSHKGKIQDKFERDVRAIAKAEKLTCTIRAERAGHVRLHISANVSDNTSQQIRNLFPFEYYERKSDDGGRRA
ncbi:DUF3634 family protein [Shewanella sp. NIFS-20-20]|uniref:DUF3634 family protein n=1 Tax=Shewanella sp. NIFS-20-20 TaxID=2853806 RepID=UPI001C45AFB3|nr:DUF3634 family protein [Shewanella sp. NIFS-20-20]MBV7314516.1 DUF3634 family protein [Shewanella sp. NIFS-20-20]